jgi:enoyl-CoA hydratase/carnithine racemase
VLLGSPGVFCAGNDLNDFLEAAKGASGLGAAVLGFVRLLPGIAKPVLAGVDGQAVGIGTTMLLHCDYVIATPASRFATPFVDLGLVPEAASSLLMPRLMGHRRAFAMLVLGEPFDAEQAREAGLINHIVDAADLEVTIVAAAKRLASKPQEAVRIARGLLRGDPSDVASRIEREAEAFAAQLTSPEVNEAIEAFFRTTACRNRAGS